MSKLYTMMLMLLLAVPTAALAQEDGSSDESSESKKAKGESASKKAEREAAEAAAAAGETGETGEAAVEEGVEAAKSKGESASDKAEREAAQAAALAEAAAEAAAADEAAAAAAAATEAAAQEGAAALEAAAAEAEQKKAKISLVAEAGVVWLAGNTSSITANGAVHFALMQGRSKFSLNIGGSYGRAVTDTDGNGKIQVGTDEWQTTAARLFGDLRYDFSIVPDVNSIYAGVGGFHDPIGGYIYRLRADIGYSHKIINTPVHLLVGEAGFNYTREFLTDNPEATIDDDASARTNNFVGARLFAGYTLTPNDTFGFWLNVETLVGGADNVDGTFDGRLLVDTGITANLSKIFSIKLGFGMNFDYVPPDVDGIEGPDVKAIDTTTTFTIVATLF